MITRYYLGGGGGSETKTRDHPGWLDGGQKGEALVPSYTVGPSNVGLSCEPSVSPALGISGGHGRGVQSLVGRPRAFHDPRQKKCGVHPLDRTTP